MKENNINILHSISALHAHLMDEPLNEPLLYTHGMDESLPPMRPNTRLPPEYLMPVPFCELIWDQLTWAICNCGICLCCII